MEEVIDQLGFIKFKNFCYVKYTIKRMRREAADEEKICAKGPSNKDYHPKYTKNS